MFARIYDFLHKYKFLRWGIFSVLTLAFVFATSNLSYKEDISDFLPLGTSDREALSIYQDISGANQIIAIFENPGDENMTVDAIEGFCNQISGNDTLGIADGIVSKFDIEEINQVTDFVYSNIPYFLTENDYHRIDSVLSNPSYIDEQLKADREMLMFPSGGLLSRNISKDPLGIFTPIVSRLNKSQTHSKFETYEGYIFSPDMKKAIVMIASPFGNSETENNSKLISILEDGVKYIQKDYPQVKVHLTGGPYIAVGNADRIKKDSILALSISFVLIVLLLCYSFRSFRNISLIAVSVAWGGLFALCGISIIHDSISIIVIGIASIIIGIAVNYPLHLIDHSIHEPNIKKALSEIVVPLVVGNVTTIGAFCALLPLKSVALRDLGLFASLLLLGTILFVLVFLPHMVKIKEYKEKRTSAFFNISNVKFENKRWIVYATMILTVIFSWYSLKTEFDSDMTNINYMTMTDKEDMAYFQSLMENDKGDSISTLYVVSTATNIDAALEKNAKNQRLLDSLSSRGTIIGRETVSDFIASKSEQQRRLKLWKSMQARYETKFKEELPQRAKTAGFSNDAFLEFYEIINKSYAPKELEEFSPLTNTVFRENFSINQEESRYSVIEKIRIPYGSMENIKKEFPGSFDVRSMNAAIANSLSEDFNYIGFACSVIVFAFLWLSFGRIELAVIAFIPMAISWIWILGIMNLLGIHFNIVNIILATFIFGQGDDYTIFMTEGCCYEYAYRKPMLASYKNSIILSALIMFIGIGSLIVAKHPALLSLAHVTIIGMFSVVFMAYIFPPLIFNWLTRTRGRYRKRPLTIASLARTWFCGAVWIFQLLLGYIIGGLLFLFFGKRDWTKSLFHKMVTVCHRIDIKLFPGVKNVINNPYNETFDTPCVIVCNHQSMLDPMYLMALSHKIIIVANRHSSLNPVIRVMFKWLDFYTVVEDNFEKDITLLEGYIKKGYSIAVYAEGERNPNSTVLRFHKGAFLLSNKLNLDILPMYLHGVNNIMPIRSFATNSGKVTMTVGGRITPNSNLWSSDYAETTRRVHKFYVSQYNLIKEQLEKSDYYLQLVKDQYLYKGVGIYSEACKALCRKNLFWVDNIRTESTVLIKNCGNGALALIAALVHPDKQVIAVEENLNNRLLATNCAQGLAKNLEIVSEYEFDPNDIEYASHGF